MDSSAKKIQISMDMFLDVYKLILALQDYDLDIYTSETIKRLERQINAKLDAMQKREVYTTYKAGYTDEEKEMARQKYLDMISMHKDWRYPTDNSKNNNNEN